MRTAIGMPLTAMSTAGGRRHRTIGENHIVAHKLVANSPEGTFSQLQTRRSRERGFITLALRREPASTPAVPGDIVYMFDY